MPVYILLIRVKFNYLSPHSYHVQELQQYLNTYSWIFFSRKKKIKILISRVVWKIGINVTV
jgi:hypothetical protein